MRPVPRVLVVAGATASLSLATTALAQDAEITPEQAPTPIVQEVVIPVVAMEKVEPAKPTCVATVSTHRRYAKAVYRRTRISAKARHKLAMMRKCAKSKAALRRMRANEKKFAEQRRIRMTMRCGTPTCNRNLILFMVSQRRGMAEAHCAVALAWRESGWRHDVYNTSGSGAYGIGQALPGSKMASHGADWATNPETQIRWFISYSVGRYGSMCGADGFQRANGWY